MICLLDFDGVVATPNPTPGSTSAPDPVAGHFVAGAAEMIEALDRSFDLFWASAWNDEANDLAASVLGGKRLRHIPLDPEPNEDFGGPTTSCWKTPQVHRWLRNRDMGGFWFDDEISRHEDISHITPMPCHDGLDRSDVGAAVNVSLRRTMRTLGMWQLPSSPSGAVKEWALNDHFSVTTVASPLAGDFFVRAVRTWDTLEERFGPVVLRRAMA